MSVELSNVSSGVLSFEDIILRLKLFWQSNQCILLEGFDSEVGAGTLAPLTACKLLDNKAWNICQVQYCRRPTDGRFAENPNRLGSYYQMQVILKPCPSNIQELCIQSLEAIGFKTEEHDIRFIEDDWQNPSIGASGFGYELWCDGMEILQFTYIQKIGGIDVNVVAGEITYGLERVAMYVQNKNNIFDIVWSNANSNIVAYLDVHSKKSEIDTCHYFQTYCDDTAYLNGAFKEYIQKAISLYQNKNYTVSYEMCLKASHSLNILDARGVLSQGERTAMILQIREIVKMTLEALAKE